MKIPSSKLIEKVAQLNDKPVILSGYILKSTDDTNDSIRLYPSLDPRCYYVFSPKCIVETMTTTDNDPDRVTLLLQSDCEIDVISRKRIKAMELTSIKKRRCNPCGDLTHDEPGIVFAEKDELRKFLIDLAKLLLDRGIKEFDCTRVSSLDAFCCREFNNLLDTVDSGGNAFDAANRVLAACSGIG